MGLTADSDRGEKSAWQAIAAVYASVPLAVVGFCGSTANTTSVRLRCG